MSDFIHQEIKGYEIVEVLGEGGFGVVYRAFQPLVKREVAVKVILPQFANQPDFVRRFESEAQLVARLEHIHIVPLYDYWRDPTGAFLVMRMLRGGTLEDVLKNGALPPDLALRLVEQIASALSVAHQTGVIHRDLKPANILLDNQNNAFLSDFGIAKTAGDAGDSGATMVGTPAYIAPEQIQNLKVGPQTDLYSFGLMVYEMFTGKQAFQGRNSSALILMQMTELVPDVQKLVPSLPRALNDAIQIATAKNPDDRYQSVTQFALAVKQAFEAPVAAPVPTAIRGADDLLIFPPDFQAFTITPELLDLEVAGKELVNPYKGLRAFQETDSDDFHGRGALIDKLLGRLMEDSPAARFLAVVGPSGSGKSSVVKAGILPKMRQGALPGSEQAFIVEMVPSTDALRELEGALMSIAINPPTNMSDLLHNYTEGLHQVIGQILPDDGSEVVLVIDQFEEVFTQTEDNNVRIHFMDMLQYAILAPDSRLRVIITIRADFFDKPLMYAEFGGLVRERFEVVLPLNHDELAEAIVKPAERVGAKIEDGLVERIIDEVISEPGALPLLQYALTELFERRTGRTITLQSYQESGGVLASLARRAEELYLEMDEARQEAIRQLFLRLVTLGEGTEDTRRRILWSELVFQQDHDDPLQKVLDSFGRYRLLTFDKDPQTREPTVEVAHEALIRQWRRLRDWLVNSREDLRAQRRLASSVQEWRNSGGDPSFLASGARLQQFEGLIRSENIALTKDEKDYIQASIVKRDESERAELLRQQREIALQRRVRQFLTGLVAVLTIATIGAVGLSIFALQQREDAIDSREQAELAQAEAEKEAAQNLALSYAQQSRQFPRDGRQPFTALAFAMEAMRVDDPPADVQRALSEVLAQPGALRRYMGHSSRVWRVDFTSDGQFMVSGGNDGEVILWDTETGQEIRRYGDYKTWVFNVDISPDDKSIITSHRTPDEGSPLELVVAFDLETGEEKWRVDFGEGHTNTVFAISYSPDGKTVYSGSFEGDPTRNLIAWDAETGEELRRYTQDGHTVRIIEVDVSPDSQILGSAGFDDNTAILWDAETARQIHKFEYPGSLVQAIQFSPDGTAVAVGVSTDSDPEDEDHIYIYSLEDYSLLQTFDLPTGLRGLHYSRDGSKVAVGGWVDNSAFVFDLATGATQRFGGAGELTVSAVFTPDGQSVVSTANGVLIRWALNGESNISRRYPTEEAGEITPLQALALSPDQTSLLVGGDDGRLSLWEAASGALLRNFAASTANINALAFSPDGSQAATAGQDGSLRLWNAATGEELQNLSQQNVPLRALAYSPDGALIAAGGGNIQISADRPADNSIRFWNTATGEAGLVLEGHTAPVRALAFSPDGTRLLSASDDRSLILWDVATGAPVLTLTGHSEAVLSLDFSADGTRALSGSADSSVILWDLGTGQILERLFGHTTSVQAVAFYPADERYAFSSSGEVDAAQSASLLMWDLEQGESIRAYSGHSRMAQAISFSADGQKMYTAGQDGALIAWQIYTPRALVDWVYTRYDVVCVENPAFGLDPATGLPTNDPRCVTHQLAGQAEEETPAEEAEVIAETVDQTEVEVSADNLCALDYTSLIPAGTVDAAAFQQAGPYVIGFSNSSSRGPDALIAGWARYQASQEAEVTSFILKNAEGDFNQQVQDVQDLLAEGAQALIINPIEQLDMSLLTAVLEQAMAQNVPVIIVNRRIENADYLSFVGPDDYEVGCVLAQEMAALMDGEGKYLQLSGIEGTLSDRTRKGAGLDVDAVYPSILSAQEAATSLTEEGIRAQVNSALQNAPQIDAIWAFDGFVAAVALEAFQAAGRDYPPVVGDGYLAFSKLAVGENIPAVQVRIPAQMGAQALQIALQALRGESVSQFSKVDLEIIPAGDLGEFDLNKPDDGTLGDYEGLPREYWGG